ncbi:hypothetical protein SprV_0301342900 [Sparganum proliferum]
MVRSPITPARIRYGLCVGPAQLPRGPIGRHTTVSTENANQRLPYAFRHHCGCVHGASNGEGHPFAPAPFSRQKLLDTTPSIPVAQSILYLKIPYHYNLMLMVEVHEEGDSPSPVAAPNSTFPGQL